ncbi:hypothetical protein FRC11_001252, partial [Ceratobasidium sp. 423]
MEILGDPWKSEGLFLCLRQLHFGQQPVDAAEIEQLIEDIFVPRSTTPPPTESGVEIEEQAMYTEIGVEPDDLPSPPASEARSGHVRALQTYILKDIDNNVVGQGAGQNEMLNDWAHNESQQYLRELYMLYAAPIGTCFCENPDPRAKQFQCDDCIMDGHFCDLCLKSMHCLAPTHRISMWNGLTWTRTSLAEQGIVVKLTKHTGCLRSQPADLLLGDITGFHNIYVTYCQCERAPNRSIQLLRSSIMPCSTKDPESGFTFCSLRLFDFLSADAKLSGSRYHSTLQWQNNNIQPNYHQHRLCELLRIMHQWTFLQALKCAGMTTTSPGDLGSLAVRCPACPRLNFNYIASDVQEDS